MGDDIIKNNISRNINKYREQRGMSQKELAQKLGVVPSRISNWETGANCPTIDILFEVCDILEVSINDIYGVYSNSKFVLQFGEQELLEKYRALDEHGMKNVNNILDNEYSRCRSRMLEGQHSLFDDFTPEELEKMVTHTDSTKSEINKAIKKTKDQESKTVTIDFGTGAIAAHNDHEDEPGEQEKMREDIANLKRPE